MTKGLPPKELIAQLKRQRSAPDPKEEEGVSQSLHPLDVLRGGKAKGNAPGRLPACADMKTLTSW